MSELLRIGLVSISDRASSGVYEDKGIPALQVWFGQGADFTMGDGDPPDPR